MHITDTERSAIEAAVAAAERATSGEIVVVLARAADDYWDFSFAGAILVALLVPAVALFFTSSAHAIYELQLGFFLATVALLRLPPMRALLVPRATRAAYAAVLARAQFVVQGLHRTAQRNGVLIFIAFAERYVEILADEGVAQRVPAGEWRDVVDALTAAIRNDRLAAGIVAAIGTCGAHLQREFPPLSTPKNQLPNRLIELA